MTNKPDDRKCGGAMDMEGESVAGTKILVARTKTWTMNRSSDGLPFFSLLIV